MSKMTDDEDDNDNEIAIAGVGSVAYGVLAVVGTRTQRNDISAWSKLWIIQRPVRGALCRVMSFSLTLNDP